MIKYQLESLLENPSLFSEMSELYSNHYGTWGKTSENAGERIKLSSKNIEKWLQNDNSYVATARNEKDNLIGYAIAIKKSKNKTNNDHIISWITQLIVHSDYRHQKIGKTLLFSFWGFSDDYAWGIMSSNPYAIRALEKATIRRVKPSLVKEKAKVLKNFGIHNIHFLDDNAEFVIDSQTSKVNTHFPSDISRIDEKLDNVTKVKNKWKDASVAFKDGFISGFISNLTTTIINMFVTTGKRVIRIIREGLFSLFRAIKLLIFPPEDMSYEDAMHEAKKLIATGLIVSMGVIAEEWIDTLIKGTAILEPFSDALTAIFVGAITGLSITMVVYYIDKKRNEKEMFNSLVNDTNTKYDNLLSSLSYEQPVSPVLVLSSDI